MLKRSLITSALAALAATPAVAETRFGEHVTLSGFGTLGAVTTNHNDAEFRSTLRQESGADKGVDFGVDSKLGLQANGQFGDTFSAVSQILVQRAATNSAALEWLYGEAKLPAGFAFKAGRMVLPTFMVSESRAVGYANHWLRAPAEFYSLYPASSFDGGQLVYRNSFGPINVTGQLSAGKSKVGVAVLGGVHDFKFDSLRSVNLLLESGSWLLRLGQTKTDLTIEGVPLPTIEDKYTGAGLQYDNGSAIVMAEYSTRREKSAAGALFDTNAWYASAGWRFGAWTPYAMVSRTLPKGIGAADHRHDRTDALGLRWDAATNVAVKAQIQNTNSGELLFTNASNSFLSERPNVRVLSLAVDFVF